jgi:hypothetical protein
MLLYGRKFHIKGIGNEFCRAFGVYLVVGPSVLRDPLIARDFRKRFRFGGNIAQVA